MAKDLTKSKKVEFINELKAINYKVNPIIKNYSQIIVTGKFESIRINLKYTRMVKWVNGLQQIWFGISQNIIKKCDYLVLIPQDAKGFYMISCRWIETNLDKLHKVNKYYYNFHLKFSEEIIVGRNKIQLELKSNCFCVFDKDIKEYHLTERELHNFPKL